MPSKKDLIIVKGDTKTLTFTFANKSDGSAFVVTGYEFFMTVKTGYSVADASATIKKDPTDFTILSNVVSVELTATNTNITPGNYIYDVQYKDTNNKIVTVVQGVIKIVDQVTIRTAAA
jgi:hypothetical protein